MSVNRKSAFFRQSSWMVIATFTGGFFMALVHTVARKMGPEEYSTFVALLRLLIIMGIPFAALQTVFARQAAAATDEQHEQQLIATSRALLLATFLVWLFSAVVLLAAARPLSNLLKITNRAGLYFTLMVGLTGLWIPVFKGLLQGRHQFGGLGWLQITDGVCRFTVMLIIVCLLRGKAAGAMCAVFAGQLATVLIGGSLTRKIWTARVRVAFDWRGWFSGAVPLSFGLGTILLMSSVDMLFVQGFVRGQSRQTALYSGAMLTGFAIIQFIAPVALVMFARVAKSVARQERSDSLGTTLLATVLFGCVAAAGCTLFPKLPLRLMYFTNPEMWKAAPLVPWFAWALLPLTVANVLLQNILAQGAIQSGSMVAARSSGVRGGALFAGAGLGANAPVRRVRSRYSDHGPLQHGALPPCRAIFAGPRAGYCSGSGFGRGARNFAYSRVSSEVKNRRSLLCRE
jgi:O-antigen/teichoic acid export membrane protein